MTAYGTPPPRTQLRRILGHQIRRTARFHLRRMLGRKQSNFSLTAHLQRHLKDWFRPPRPARRLPVPSVRPHTKNIAIRSRPPSQPVTSHLHQGQSAAPPCRCVARFHAHTCGHEESMRELQVCGNHRISYEKTFLSRDFCKLRPHDRRVMIQKWVSSHVRTEVIPSYRLCKTCASVRSTHNQQSRNLDFESPEEEDGGEYRERERGDPWEWRWGRKETEEERVRRAMREMEVRRVEEKKRKRESETK